MSRIDRAFKSIYSIHDDEPIVVYCEAGYSSKLVAFILGFYGIKEVYYSGLTDIRNESLIDFDFNNLTLNEIMVSSVILPHKNNYFLRDKLAYILFTSGDICIFNQKKNFNLFKNNDLLFFKANPNVWSGLLTRYNWTDNLKEFNISNLNSRNIICRNEFHCYLTRQFLISMNVSSNIEIYFI